MNHQFTLFGYQRPTKKVPISKERLEEVKRLVGQGDDKKAVEVLREIRYRLEAYLKER